MISSVEMHGKTGEYLMWFFQKGPSKIKSVGKVWI